MHAEPKANEKTKSSSSYHQYTKPMSPEYSLQVPAGRARRITTQGYLPRSPQNSREDYGQKLATGVANDGPARDEGWVVPD